MSQIFALLLLLIPMVVIHEMGHFLAAKFFGMRVYEFAFGFGKKLASFRYGNTEYRFNLLPLGGYVNFMGESLYHNDIPHDPDHFLNKPKYARLVVLLMGPAFNFFLAFGLFVLLQHQPDYIPKPYGEPFTVGWVAPDSPEAQAGLQTGDRITHLQGQPVVDRERLLHDIVLSPGETIRLRVERNGETRDLAYVCDTDEIEGIGKIQFRQAFRSRIARVVSGYPAEEVGLMPDDIIVAIDETPAFIVNTSDFNVISQLIQHGDGDTRLLRIERDGVLMDFKVPLKELEDGSRMIGISYGYESQVLYRTWPEATASAWERCVFFSTYIFRTINRLVSMKLSVKALNSPVSISRIAKEELEQGFWPFVLLMAILSLNLAIANLLPIPVLDGGEILVIMVEWVARRDLSFDMKQNIKMVGFIFLVGLMGTVLVSDTIKEFVLRNPG
ncbi:MAG: RIP metalloprotease RseP [Acidobacteria bacterium]|nr:RIP metalloprotease RseP [Acidobacteriota bacterium]